MNTISAVMLFNGSTAPEGWLICDGQFLSEENYPQLFNLIGLNYGGDSPTNFALPKFDSIGNCIYIICVKGEFPMCMW